MISQVKHITFVMPWHISERGGGAEVQANYLAQELAHRGFKVSYVCQTINAEKANSIEIVGNITINWMPPSGRFKWMDQNKYLKALEHLQPDLIIQRLSSNVTYVIAKYCKQSSCRFVWMCTDNMAPSNHFHTNKFKDYNTIKGIGMLKYMVFLMNAKIMDVFRNKGMRHIDVAFSQNDEQHDHLIKNFNLKSHRMISGHPVPTLRLTVQERFQKKTILWCGNLGKHKRPELFIELAKHLEKSNVTCIMVGGHSDRAYVSQLLKHKPENLVATGQLSFEESLHYFDNASLLVNTSVSEGFSNTYIQAWLRGVPTIVFGADPNDVIKHHKLGYDVKSVDEAALKINQLHSDKETYQTLSENSLAFAQENHSIEVMTTHFLCVLSKEIPINQ